MAAEAGEMTDEATKNGYRVLGVGLFRHPPYDQEVLLMEKRTGRVIAWFPLDSTAGSPLPVGLPKLWHLHGQGITLKICTSHGMITDVKRAYPEGLAARPESDLSHGQVLRRCNQWMDQGVLMAAYQAMLTGDGDLLKKYIHDMTQGF